VRAIDVTLRVTATQLHEHRKDMVISGGFNIYPSDMEAVLRAHPGMADVAVIGVPSAQVGETPLAFVVLAADAVANADEIRAWANDRLGKTQRVSAVRRVGAFPRSGIGKLLKRELREAWTAASSEVG
jgi:acyl-CoA synthetase (AMP-forming)/AMP-acid ligase II